MNLSGIHMRGVINNKRLSLLNDCMYVSKWSVDKK